MDINLLAINVGNSRLAIGVFAAGTLEYVQRIDVQHRELWPAAIREAWGRLASGGDAAVVGASVNPPLIEPIEHAIMQVTNQPVQWVGREIDLPIKVLTENPAQTGVDRILNMAAAYEQIEKACVVVDAGTAITVNVCNDAGEFLGGAITPGATTMLNALHERTASLPRIKLQPPTDVFGKTTESAILNGIFHGIRGMVKELVETYATEFGNWPEIVATGGDAKVLFGDWELIHAISPDLTLYGIALAYAEHHIRNQTEG